MRDIWFTGFDSAWGGTQRGALCNLHGRVQNGSLVLNIESPIRDVNWDEAIACINGYGERSDHIIAIDQGLVVPNETGMRPVERQLARALMGTYKCGAHASNTGNTRCYGPQAGIWRYQQALLQNGYQQCPLAVAQRKPGRFYFECYPHPALLGLFELDRILPYKIHKRDRQGWQHIINLLRSLKDRELSIENVQHVVSLDLEQRKLHEDWLDSLIAAYVAAYWWWYGTSRSAILGSLSTGYMVTPYSEAMIGGLRAAFPVEQFNPEGCVEFRFPPVHHPLIANEEAANVRVQNHKNLLDLENDAETVDLVANDTGNLWCSRNPWMVRNRCAGGELRIQFVEIDDQPMLTFVPFVNVEQGLLQGGMRPADDDTRLVWDFLTDGAANATPRSYRVRYSYT